MSRIEMQNLTDRHWREVFNKYDRDRDGSIMLFELKAVLESREYDNDIPDHVIKSIFRKHDTNLDERLDYNEFIEMVHHPNNAYFFEHLHERAKQYIKFVVPPRPRRPTTVVDGLYDEEYSCWPPAVIMIIVSLLEIILYCADMFYQHDEQNRIGPVATALLYDPHRRKECWRYVTYMFVHIGYFHLIVNIFVQILLGIPLEMVHRGWRVVVIYLAGVIAGSLGTSITDPSVRLAGASGGVYSLITAHLATIIMNWKEMTYPIIQLFIFVMLIASDVGTSIYNRYVLNLDESIGYAAHFFGALAGLLIGIMVLRNIEVHRHERILQWFALVLYVLLMGIAIVWSAVYTGHFPVQYV